MDLLRACQREGIVRLERDRRGGLRVFQGATLQRPPAIVVDAVPIEIVESQPGEPIVEERAMEPEPPEIEPMPIDTTAELLGRAKPKRARDGRGARKAAAPKPRRAGRSKKEAPAAAAHNNDNT